MITLYTKTNCPQCDTLKAQLKNADVEFSEVLVNADTAARDFLLSKGHRSVPVMYRDGIHLKNFSEV